MNPAQTRPPALTGRRTLGRFSLRLALLLGSFGCNAVERDRPAPHSPPPPSAEAVPVPAASHAAAGSSAEPAAPTADAGSAQASPAAAEPRAGSLTRRYRVAAVGDSLTDPRSHGGGYLAYLKQRCPALEVDNFGRGGTMVNQMRRHFEEDVLESRTEYTHLIVFGGVNDLYSDLTALRTPAKIEADLSTMYDAAKSRGLKVVALTVAPWGGFTRYFNPSRAEATHALNAWIREQPAHGHVDSVVDAYTLLSCGDPDTLCDRFFKPFKDGIHFGPEAHQLLGEALFRAAFFDCE